MKNVKVLAYTLYVSKLTKRSLTSTNSKGYTISHSKKLDSQYL